MQVLLAPDGVVTMEFPHLLRLIEETEFDTIYHEHFSYFSLLTVERVFAAHGLADLRRRGAADARRLAADLCARTRTARQPETGGRASSRSASAAAGLDDLGDVRAVRASGVRRG